MAIYHKKQSLKILFEKLGSCWKFPKFILFNLTLEGQGPNIHLQDCTYHWFQDFYRNPQILMQNLRAGKEEADVFYKINLVHVAHCSPSGVQGITL